MDLWWLINCKKRNGHGRIVFFEPEPKLEKTLLAQAYQVEVRDAQEFDGNYQRYYRSLLENEFY